MPNRRTSSDSSFDLRLLWMLCGSLLLQIFLSIDGWQRLVIATIEFCFLVGLSIRYRLRQDWRWPGISWLKLSKHMAVIGWNLILGMVFIGNMTNLESPTWGRNGNFGVAMFCERWMDGWHWCVEAFCSTSPWSAAIICFAFGMFFCWLEGLNLTSSSQQTFLINCQKVKSDS
jgi:hypothetical protein